MKKAPVLIALWIFFVVLLLSERAMGQCPATLDPNLADAIRTLYPTAGLVDATNALTPAAATYDGMLDFSGWGNAKNRGGATSPYANKPKLTSIEGIQCFTSLKSLTVGNQALSSLPAIPANLDTLRLYGNPLLQCLPTLPQGLKVLNLGRTDTPDTPPCGVRCLPNLPSSLVTLLSEDSIRGGGSNTPVAANARYCSPAPVINSITSNGCNIIINAAANSSANNAYLRYSIDGGATYAPLGATLANSGTSFSAPTVSGVYRIRVRLNQSSPSLASCPVEATFTHTGPTGPSTNVVSNQNLADAIRTLYPQLIGPAGDNRLDLQAACFSGILDFSAWGNAGQYASKPKLTSLSGIELFPNLGGLNVRNQALSSLSGLPATLTSLLAGGNTISSLPPLPGNLQALDISRNTLTGLPALPATLTYLDVTSNSGLTCLPTLPTNFFTVSLPSTVADPRLRLEGTAVTCLPNLPSGADINRVLPFNFAYSGSVCSARPSLTPYITCAQNNAGGAITIGASLLGGIEEYEYSLNGSPYSNQDTYTDLSPGTYIFQVRRLAPAGCASIPSSITVSLTNCLDLSSATSFYVSPTGSDSNPGTEAAPFATLAKAKETVQAHPQRGQQPLVVYLRGGTYPQSQPLVFNENDGGSVTAGVYYRAFGNEKPVISGGQRVTGWTAVPGKPYFQVGNLPLTTFREFYVNGKRKTRARTNDPVRALKGILNAAGQATGFVMDTFYVKPLQDTRFLEYHGNGIWRDFYVPIDKVELVDGKLEFYMNRWAIFRNDNAKIQGLGIVNYFRLENSLDLLDRPGEWFCDRDTGILYYYPEAGEDLSTAEAIVPVAEQILSVRGTTKATKVRNLHFQGLTFAYSGWTAPNKDGIVTYQSEYLYYPTGTRYNMTPGSVQVEYAENVSFRYNDFTNVATVGLNLLNGVYRSDIVGNRFLQTGHGGLNVANWTTFNFNLTSIDSVNYIRIQDNLFYQTGSIFAGSPAMSIWYAKGIRVHNNEIIDVPYTGIQLGYGFGKADMSRYAGDNFLVANRIGHFLRVTNDGGGIYTLGAQPNSFLRNNYIFRGINSEGGLYHDEGSAYLVTERNVVDNTFPRWLFNWTPNSKYITVRNNYSNTEPFYQRSVYSSLSGTTYFTGSSFPAAAQPIVDAAGIRDSRVDRSPVTNWAQTNTAPLISASQPAYTFNLSQNGVVEVVASDITDPLSRFGVKWSKVSGPGDVTFSDPGSQRTKVAFSAAGSYVLQALASDGFLNTSVTITVTVRQVTLPPNVAPGKSIVASSEEPGFEAAKAIDNDGTTFWRAAVPGGNPTLTLDLGDTLRIHRIEYVPLTGNNFDWERKFFTVRANNTNVFDNASQYDVLLQASSNADNFANTLVWNGEAGKRYRYLRWTNNIEWVKEPKEAGKLTTGLGELRIYASREPLPVRPVLECVQTTGNGSYIAYFGYQNENAFALEVPVGSQNYFSPVPQAKGQPAVFQPGRQVRAFSVSAPSGTLVWNLLGRTSTATATSTPCLQSARLAYQEEFKQDPAAAYVIYPNPSSGGRIQVKVGERTSLTHVGMTGLNGGEITIHWERSQPGEVVITPRRPLASGVYLLLLQGETGTVVRRVLVEGKSN